jgi:CDP-glycerol glycerophosphotransferase (TagB/SpsB family)
MRTVLFCEHKYAISILSPLQEEAARMQSHDVLWFVDRRNIPDFEPENGVRWTNCMQDVYDFSPEAIFVPGNIVPYYLPGVKAEIFHGYAAEKKDHWIIRRYLDLYLTQGPYFTKKFKELANRYGDFEVVETGWSRQDWIFANLHAFDGYRNELLVKYGKHKIILYAPTFSPGLTSLPCMKDALKKLAQEKDIVLLLKFHPLTRREWVDEYRRLADTVGNILWIDDHNVTKYILACDLMISDTSSTVYESLLLDKPVVTFRTAAKDKYWLDIDLPEKLGEAVELAQNNSEYAQKRRWIIENYDPHLDGKAAQRMFEAVENYIARHGVPQERQLNLWRKYQSIKKFGKIKRK